jgi:hypothetical protein
MDATEPRNLDTIEPSASVNDGLERLKTYSYNV